jgi:hypothetical protein
MVYAMQLYSKHPTSGKEAQAAAREFAAKLPTLDEQNAAFKEIDSTVDHGGRLLWKRADKETDVHVDGYVIVELLNIAFVCYVMSIKLQVDGSPVALPIEAIRPAIHVGP